MIAVLLAAIAAGLLVHGTTTGSTVEVVVAGALGLAVMGLCVAWPRRSDEVAPTMPATETPPQNAQAHEAQPQKTQPVSAPAPSPAESSASAGDRVVFVAGRTTFHAPTCASVEGKATSQAERGELERGGMTACRRCLSPS